MARLRDWVDHRTGLGGVIDALLIEHIPGGAKWRYVWGSALAFVFAIQLVTGVLLMTAYSPGDTTAWSSVYFIQYQMDFGWFIRGLHHFGSQTMVVLMGVHMLQVVIAGAHLKPREVNWWLGLGLMGIILALSLTGYLLPWDQKGYYATQVATNIAGNIPLVGPFVQKVVVGGPEYGNHTLTRFFALHVAILPGLAIALLIAHVWVFRRHGITTPKNAVGSGWFWPDQAFKDMVVSMIIFAIMIGLVLYGWGNKVEPKPDRDFYDKAAHAGQDGRGANLDAPADPDSPYPARPEWYFLFLFQLLKYFEGPLFLVGTLAIPGAVGLLLFILPWLGYGPFRKIGHVFAVMVVLALLGGAAYLTAQAWVEDQSEDTLKKTPYSWLKAGVAGKRYDPVKGDGHQKEMERAEEKAQRAVQLAGEGIPAEGGRYLLRRDPLTKGKELFKQHCATCHAYTDSAATRANDQLLNKEPTASDLTEFGQAEWVRGILTQPDDKKYFGLTKLTDMTKWVKGQRDKAGKANKLAGLENDFDAIAAWLAAGPRKDPATLPESDPFVKGFQKFDKYCSECHSYRNQADEGSKGPDLTGYGDADWLRAMIVAPNSPLRYGQKNRMPAFRAFDGPGSEMARDQQARELREALKAHGEPPEDAAGKNEHVAKRKDIEIAHKTANLGDVEREMIIRFLLKDFRVVFGGAPIGGPPKK